MSGEQQPRDNVDTKAMNEIIGYLKNYPFLLITIAGLLILSAILIFDIEKLKEFKWLVYGVVLVPLGIQFFIEFKKMQIGHGSTVSAPPTIIPAAGPSPNVIVQPAISPARLSGKAIASMVIAVLLFLAMGEWSQTELQDRDTQTGLLVFALVALGLGISGWRDASRQQVRGKALAVTGTILSAILSLSSVGWISQSIDPDIAGSYMLESYSVNGQVNPVPMTAQMTVGLVSANFYRWESALQMQNPDGVPVAVNYQGTFQNNNGIWSSQVTTSTDPSWQNVGAIPITMIIANGVVSMHYVSQGSAIVENWRKIGIN